MDSSNLLRGAIGFYLESLAGPLKYYFNEPDLLVLFKDYAPIPKSGVWGAKYRQTLMALPSQEQVNTLVKELIVKDRVKEEMPSIASNFGDISIRFHPWVGLEVRLTGIQ